MHDKHTESHKLQRKINSESLHKTLYNNNIKFRVHWAAAPLREWGQEEGVSWEASGEHWKRERDKINEMLIR